MNHIKPPIDPKHDSKRRFLRIAGVSLLTLGIILLIIGLVDFFSAFGSFGGPKYFWINFIALPLIFVGASMTSMGYMGAMARYTAQENAPVASDTFNYLAEETKGGIRTMARAVKEGMEDKGTVICPNCHKDNPLNAAFCNGCGASLTREIACPQCGWKNPAGSRFCNGCGQSLEN